MRYRFLLILSVCLVLLQACIYDCLSKHDGVVTDNISGKPIDGVNVCVLWKDTIINDYGVMHDSLPINKRMLLINKGNKENWWDPQDGTNRMAKSAPFYTDSSGYYEVKLFTGFAPKHLRLIFLKEGYNPFITKELDPVTTINIKLEKR